MSLTQLEFDFYTKVPKLLQEILKEVKELKEEVKKSNEKK